MEVANTEEEIETAVATMLGVEDPVVVVAASQATVDYEDDTDFEEIAKFDLQEWLQEQGLAETKDEEEKKKEEAKPTILQTKQLKKAFSVPEPK